MKKKFLFPAAAVLLAGLTVSVFFWNPVLHAHNRALGRAIAALPEGTEQVSLNEVVPFPWDCVYTFPPYTDRETIEEAIGFSSPAIRETVSEGMVQLLFVKGRTVTASVSGYADALGYDLRFSGESISYKEDAVCSVAREDGVVTLEALAL